MVTDHTRARKTAEKAALQVRRRALIEDFGARSKAGEFNIYLPPCLHNVDIASLGYIPYTITTLQRKSAIFLYPTQYLKNIKSEVPRSVTLPEGNRWHGDLLTEPHQLPKPTQYPSDGRIPTPAALILSLALYATISGRAMTCSEGASLKGCKCGGFAIFYPDLCQSCILKNHGVFIHRSENSTTPQHRAGLFSAKRVNARTTLEGIAYRGVVLPPGKPATGHFCMEFERKEPGKDKEVVTVNANGARCLGKWINSVKLEQQAEGLPFNITMSIDSKVYTNCIFRTQRVVYCGQELVMDYKNEEGQVILERHDQSAGHGGRRIGAGRKNFLVARRLENLIRPVIDPRLNPSDNENANTVGVNSPAATSSLEAAGSSSKGTSSSSQAAGGSSKKVGSSSQAAGSTSKRGLGSSKDVKVTSAD